MKTIRGLQVAGDSLSQGELLYDPRWGAECLAFNLQIAFREREVLELRAVTEALHATFPSQQFVPSSALHISVLNLIPARDEAQPEVKATLWAQHGTRWLRSVDEVMRQSHPFDITLSTLALTPTGVLAASFDSADLVAMRERLVRELDLPLAHTPELCHSTLMRFGPRVPDIDELRTVLQGLTVNVTLRVSEVLTVRELVYPSLLRELVRTHQLGQDEAK